MDLGQESHPCWPTGCHSESVNVSQNVGSQRQGLPLSPQMKFDRDPTSLLGRGFLSMDQKPKLNRYQVPPLTLRGDIGIDCDRSNFVLHGPQQQYQHQRNKQKQNHEYEQASGPCRQRVDVPTFCGDSNFEFVHEQNARWMDHGAASSVYPKSFIRQNQSCLSGEGLGSLNISTSPISSCSSGGGSTMATGASTTNAAQQCSLNVLGNGFKIFRIDGIYPPAATGRVETPPNTLEFEVTSSPRAGDGLPSAAHPIVGSLPVGVDSSDTCVVISLDHLLSPISGPGNDLTSDYGNVDGGVRTIHCGD